MASVDAARWLRRLPQRWRRNAFGFGLLFGVVEGYKSFVADSQPLATNILAAVLG